MRRPRSPTVEVLALFAVTGLLQLVAGALGSATAPFVLATPLTRPWTLATSVYAHASLGHLLANAVALVLVGLLVERVTTRARFHGFVLATGALSGVAEVAVGSVVAPPTAVIGASGAVLALYGYALSANALVRGLLDRVDLSPRATLAVLAGLALLVTLLTAGPGVALVAHATGFTLGVLAGRARLLHVGGRDGALS